MYSAGGPFGHGVLGLDVSTAEVAGIDVSIGGACAYGKALGRTCLFGGPCCIGGSSGCLVAPVPVSIEGCLGSASIGGRGG